jgi:hypothetical protein
MSKAIPAGLEKSAGLLYVVKKGWNWQGPSNDQIQVENCPVCHKGDFKFYMGVCDPEASTRDGL